MIGNELPCCEIATRLLTWVGWDDEELPKRLNVVCCERHLEGFENEGYVAIVTTSPVLMVGCMWGRHHRVT